MLFHESGTLPTPMVGSLAGDVRLPRVDVRTGLNERALRGWTESSRRLVRIAVLVGCDVVAGLIGIVTVQLTWQIVSGGGRRPLPDVVPLLAMVFCLQPLALRVTGAYAAGGARRDVLKISGGICIAALLGWAQAHLFGRTVADLPNKTAYVYSAAVITAYAWILRALVDKVIVAGYRAGVLQRRVLMVGSRTEARELSRLCQQKKGCEFRVIGRLDPHPHDFVEEQRESPVANEDVPDVGSLDALEQVLSRTGAQGLIVSSGLPINRIEGLVDSCFQYGATVSIVPHTLKKLSATQIEVRQTAIGALLQLRPVRLAVPQLAVKRTMDIVLTLAGLAFIWPLLLLIAIAIKLDSAGPILFGQIRTGVGGRPFRMLKFRTMRDGADAEKVALANLNESADPRLFKIKNDPRATRVGRFLRRTSLDELPQGFNVLRGDMSLVGPRPFFPRDLAGYERHHFERLHVLPGITGLWQVSGRSDVVDFEEVIRLDREYIENWSMVTDISILLRTLPAALGKGAY